jgi:hypothetical protein
VEQTQQRILEPSNQPSSQHSFQQCQPWQGKKWPTHVPMMPALARQQMALWEAVTTMQFFATISKTPQSRKPAPKTYHR